MQEPIFNGLIRKYNEMSYKRDGEMDWGDMSTFYKIYAPDFQNQQISASGIDKLCEINHKGQYYSIGRLNWDGMKHVYVLGEETKEMRPNPKPTSDNKYRHYWQIITVIKMGYNTRFKKIYNDKLRIVEGISTYVQYRRNGFATAFYESLVRDLKYVLMSDTIQYDGDRKTWYNFSHEDKYVIDIVDITTSEIVAKDVQLKSMDDSRVWRYKEDGSKSFEDFYIGKNHRLVMRRRD